MKPIIVIAPDKFKGSLNAWEAAESIVRGLRRGGLGNDRAEFRLLPIADGGEGTAEVICRACGGKWEVCQVRDALGRPVEARYALVEQDGSRVAVLEMSLAAGLWRLRKEELGRRDASTRGVGEMILHAAAQGVQRILLGLGGSATNDGGVGMAQALGVRFLDREGREVDDLPRELERIQTVDFTARCALPELVAMCDVTNPLLGPLGCTRVFGPQKGFREFAGHETGLRSLVESVIRSGYADYSESPGAGAAGGLGFGCLAFGGARLERGFTVISGLLGLEDAIRAARLVVTGEGSLDRQTLNGKGPHGVLLLARHWDKPVLTFCGICEDSEELKGEFGEVRTLKAGNQTVEECMARARELLELRAFEASEWAIRQIAG